MSFEIITQGCEAMIRELAVQAGHGANTKLALDVTAGKILETAIRYTPMATREELVERVHHGVMMDFATYDLVGGEGTLHTNVGLRGQLPAGTQWLRQNGVNYIMKGGNPRRWSNARWALYQATAEQRENDVRQSLEIRTRKAVAAIGLTRQSWVQIADALGIKLRSPNLALIRAAVASDGVTYTNASGTRGETDSGPFIDLENHMSGLLSRQGADILQRAIDTRLAGFAKDMEKGVMDDLKVFARRYPGLQITTDF